MKKLLKSIPFLILFLTSGFAFGGNFEIPKNYKFNTPEDYATYEPQILECINWLSKLKLDQWQDKRVEAEKFLMAWVEGNPKFKVELNPNIMTFTETNPTLKAIFVGGWVKYALANPLDMSDLKGNVAGLKAVCKYYETEVNLNRDKNIEHLAKLRDKGELKKHVKEQLKA